MTTYPATIIADRLWAAPNDRVRAGLRHAALITTFSLATAALAQWKIHLGFTPVPITGQTLGVLLAGGALGWRDGAASQALYWGLGLALPFYAGGKHGWREGTGATFGYFVGFVVAAAVIGYLAERKQDRNLATSWSAMALGSVVIYVFGAGWLAHSLGVPVANGKDGADAIAYGVTPFLIGDLLKMLLAGALLPATWKLVERNR
jgi:biotin transport system substrate-specific component